jgi:hypothetical protein
LNPKFILGCTDTDTVKLDFDNTNIKDAKYWAFRTMKWFKLRGFIILRSSENCYHVVFDRRVSWRVNVKIMAWVSLLSHKVKLQKWFTMQCIKQGSTLRISPKGDKTCPRIVYCYGEQGGQIKEFTDFRKMVKKMMRNLNRDSDIEYVIKTT